MDKKLIQFTHTRVELEFIQQIYDIANEKTKEMLCQIYPQYMIEADINWDNIHESDVIGYAGGSYTTINKASDVKYNIVDEPKPWRESRNIRDCLYPDIMKVNDNETLLLFWASPRDGDDYITGFYILKKRNNY